MIISFLLIKVLKARLYHIRLATIENCGVEINPASRNWDEISELEQFLQKN